MRWYAPKRGDVRVIKKFAIFPITINGETRWLEWVRIRQTFAITIWIDEGFVDNT